MKSYTQKTRDDYNASRPTIAVEGRALDMTSGNDYRVFTAALIHGSNVMLTDNAGRDFALSIRSEYKAELKKDQPYPAAWWDVWTTLGGGARFAEGQSRAGMGAPLVAKAIQGRIEQIKQVEAA